MPVGTREQVWAGTHSKTSGGLRKDDLMLNPAGKLVSKKQSMAAKERYPELVDKLCSSKGFKKKEGEPPKGKKGTTDMTCPPTRRIIPNLSATEPDRDKECGVLK